MNKVNILFISLQKSIFGKKMVNLVWSILIMILLICCFFFLFNISNVFLCESSAKIVDDLHTFIYETLVGQLKTNTTGIETIKSALLKLTFEENVELLKQLLIDTSTTPTFKYKSHDEYICYFSTIADEQKKLDEIVNLICDILKERLNYLKKESFFLGAVAGIQFFGFFILLICAYGYRMMMRD